MKRLKITVNGQVQRVGYRDAVTDIARQLGLKGTVRNLEDEVSVEIIAEGEEKKLDEFVKLLNIKKYPIEVEKTDVKEEEATGKFQYFKILRGEGFSELGDRLDHAGKLLYKSLEKQDQTIKKLEEFNHSTQQQFQHLDVKYGKVSEKLERISNSLEKLVDILVSFKPK